MKKAVYDYLSKPNLQELVIEIRKRPYSEEKHYLWMDDNTMIEDTRPFLLTNALIASTLDSFGIYERRNEFVFFESYDKGKPGEYMTRVKDTLLSMNINDIEFMLYHILSAIKGCFHLVTVVADRIISLDHSFDDYLDAYDNNEIFRNLIDNPELHSKMDPYTLSKGLNTIPDHFTNDIEIRPISEMMRAGVKMNKKQIMQNIMWGLVPDVINPSIMAKYFVSEGCLTGYTMFESYFIDQLIGRKAILTAKSEVQDVGATAKRIGVFLMMVTMNAPKTREYTHDCGTKRHMFITIKNKRDLAYHRYTYFKNGIGIYDYVDLNRSDLIGKTLECRSMIFCESDHICETCFGHLAQFNRDTLLTKFNLGIETSVELSKKMQGVISIKHAISGILLDIFVTYLGERMHIMDFVNSTKHKIVKAFEYNKLILDNKNYNIVITKEKNNYTLYIDNRPVTFEFSKIVSYTEEKDGLHVIINLPNKSVLTEADDLQMALNYHHRADEFKNGWDKDMNINQKLEYVHAFIEKYMKFEHRRFSETLTYAMVRDIDTPSKRVKEDSRDIKFIKAVEVVSRPNHSDNLSTTIPYGYVSDQLKHIKDPSNNGVAKPSDYDLLYMSRDINEEISPYLKTSALVNRLKNSAMEITME